MAKGHPLRYDLLDYVEGALDPEDSATIRQHLDTCSACRELVADVATGKRLLAAAPSLELSPARANAMAAALAEPAPKQRRPSWRLAAVVAVALAVAVPLSYIALSSGGGGTDSAAVDEQAGGAATGAASEDDGGEAAPQSPSRAVVRGVTGSPEEIASVLEEKGYDATVEGPTVVVIVKDAGLKKLAAVLDNIGSGDTIVLAERP